MKQWKIQQAIYHKSTPVEDFHTDASEVIHEASDLRTIAKSYFHQEWPPQLLYPAKTYAVATIYAVLINRYFGDDIRDVLNDPNLLYGNDKHFVPYSESPELYDDLIQSATSSDVETSTLNQVQTTVKCFKDEFLLT